MTEHSSLCLSFSDSYCLIYHVANGREKEENDFLKQRNNFYFAFSVLQTPTPAPRCPDDPLNSEGWLTFLTVFFTGVTPNVFGASFGKSRRREDMEVIFTGHHPLPDHHVVWAPNSLTSRSLSSGSGSPSLGLGSQYSRYPGHHNLRSKYNLSASSFDLIHFFLNNVPI